MGRFPWLYVSLRKIFGQEVMVLGYSDSANTGLKVALVILKVEHSECLGELYQGMNNS